jgi:Ca2+-binding EF-hand superfamily protein
MKMLGELQTQKLTKMFKLHDSDGSGFLEKADLELRLQQDSSTLGLSSGSAEYEAYSAKLLSEWETMQENMDTDKDGLVSLEEWLQYHDKMLSSEGYKAFVGAPLVDTLDSDGDGKISCEAYKSFRKGRGLKDSELDEMCSRFDLDGDGYIETKDLLRFREEFYVSNDSAAPGNWFCGEY